MTVAAPPTHHLEARGLRGGYNKLEVLHGVDLHVDAGEIVALFGPNGAGKTTLLMTINGVLPPMGGEILWDGADRPAPPHRLARRGVALVTERSVFQRLSAEANLRLGRGDVSRALDLFPELRPLLGRRAGLLSGGEQQMLTMARALASRPTALLLDEVSAGLAPLVVNRLFEAARVAAKEEGVAILLVEQQIRRAVSVADRIYVLNDGHITFNGTQAELRKKPELIEESFFVRRRR